MAEGAGFIDRRLLQQKVVVAIVRIVTIAACHAAESKRMAAGLVGIRPFPGVATEAGFLLRQGVKDTVAFTVYLVTGCTTDVFELMCTAEPANAALGLVAVETNPILFLRRGKGRGAKSTHWNFIPALALSPRMFLARAMTGLALQSRKGRIRVGAGCVFGLKNSCGGLVRAVFMAQDA